VLRQGIRAGGVVVMAVFNQVHRANEGGFQLLQNVFSLHHIHHHGRLVLFNVVYVHLNHKHAVPRFPAFYLQPAANGLNTAGR